MKKLFISAFCILGLCFLLCFPSLALEASQKGLSLWFETLLPTLLPFLIISQLILKSNVVTYIQKPFSPLFRKLFHVSESGSFCILCGFLCGYPVGARLIALQVREKRISTEEGQYLLSFCNNVSPMFCISYGIRYGMENTMIFPALFSIYAAPIVYAVLTRKKYISASQSTKKQISIPENIFQLIDICIIDSFEIMIRLCGYLILFSIIIHGLQSRFLRLPHMLLTLLSCTLEITNGLSLVHTLPIGIRKDLLGIFALSFGGLCCILQTRSVLGTSVLSIRKYIHAKLCTTLLSLLFYVCISFFLSF
ncbi:MAG: transporter [Lachnospiraceae bacterium]